VRSRSHATPSREPETEVRAHPARAGRSQRCPARARKCEAHRAGRRGRPGNNLSTSAFRTLPPCHARPATSAAPHARTSSAPT
jgi:hypothetical protein